MNPVELNNDNHITSIQLIPIIISSLAFALSIISLIFNYYIQYIKKPSIQIIISDKLKSWSGDGKFIFNNSITIFNKGAQYGAIYKMKAELFHVKTDTLTTLEWNMFVQDKNIGIIGEQFKSHSTFESWAETILIQGRTAITKKIQFKSNEDFILKAGDYIMEIFIFSGTDKQHSCSAIKQFKVGQIELDRWAETIKNFNIQNQVAKSSLVFKLKDRELTTANTRYKQARHLA